MRPGETKKACPGCGQPCRFNPRPVNGVCSDCRKILDRSKDRVEEKALKKEGLRPYFFPERSYALPYIRHEDHDHTIRNTFHALAKAIRVPDPDADRKHCWFANGIPELVEYRKRDSHDWADTAMFQPKIAAAFKALYSAIRDGVEQAYRDGHTDGSNLLRQLREGDVTLFDFERARDEA